MKFDDSSVWTEKYRPKKLSDVKGNEEKINAIQNYLDQHELIGLLLAGPAGVGKTTVAKIVGHEFFGKYYNDNFHELNASDERGINIVRNKIKGIAQNITMGNSDFQIIFLDEADNITPDAQAALRSTMEEYTDNCRFILSCNFASKIIDPIASRCAFMRFGRIGNDTVKKQINEISNKENVSVTDSGLNAIVYSAHGDMRKAIQNLQSMALTNQTITAELVYETIAVNPDIVKNMLTYCFMYKFTDAKVELESLIFGKGYSGDDIIMAITEYIHEFGLNDEYLTVIAKVLGETDFRLTEGANDVIQLNYMIAAIIEGIKLQSEITNIDD